MTDYPLRPECCRNFALTCKDDLNGEHHPACQHAPPTTRNWHGATPAQLTRQVKEAFGDTSPMLRLVPDPDDGETK